MAKGAVLLILSACLSLQLITAFPHQHSLNSVEDNYIKSEESIKSTDVDFRTTLHPVVLNTLAVIQEHSNTLIQETAKFVGNLLVELNALPEENEYIQNLIPELTSILVRLEKVDLDSDSPLVLYEKAALLRAIAKMYIDFEQVSKSTDDTSETAVLKKVFEKLQLNELNDRINRSVNLAVNKFTVVFAHFWEGRTAAQKEGHQDMSDWYARFQASESVQEKFKGFIEFVQILQSIFLNHKN